MLEDLPDDSILRFFTLDALDAELFVLLVSLNTDPELTTIVSVKFDVVNLELKWSFGTGAACVTMVIELASVKSAMDILGLI